MRAGRFLTARPPRFTFAAVAAATAARAGRHRRRLRRSCARRSARPPRATRKILADTPACFGAAARDPERPCANPRLRLVVGADAERGAQQPQRAVHDHRARRRRLPVRRRARQGRRHGRARRRQPRRALAGRARRRRARQAAGAASRSPIPSCPFSKATEILTEPSSTECLRWKRQVFEWFERHPEVTTVFVGQISGGRGVVRPPGADNTELEIAGYLGAWKALPATVKHVIVLRDTPKIQARTLRLHPGGDRRRAARPGRRCAEPRAEALDPDTALAAARTGARRPRRGGRPARRTSATRSAATRSWAARWSTRTRRTSRPCSPRRSGPTCSGRSSVSTRQRSAERYFGPS